MQRNKLLCLSVGRIILMHIVLMGVPMKILFFPAVLALVVWQGLFGIGMLSFLPVIMIGYS